MGIRERSPFAALLDVGIATPAMFAFFTEEWQDMVTMRCEIPSGMESSEAGFAVHGSEPQGFTGGRFPKSPTGEFLRSGNRYDRSMILLVDNDLRGFRLDGKTYAEDYSRYGDGTGVRVKFSKGISTELAANNFVLELPLYTTYSSTPTIYSVDHTAGSRYATIIFDRAVNEGVVRLVGTTPTASIVMDIDNEVLVDGSFVAALHYDSDAPRVTSFTKDGNTVDGMSTWRMSFSALVNEATLQADNFCITSGSGSDTAGDACVIEAGRATTPSIVLMSFIEDSTTSFVMRVNEGDGKIGGTLSIEPRRNAILGEDLKVVEDYQKALRGVLEIEDTQGPTIRVRLAEAEPQASNYNMYRIVFLVESDEFTADLVNPSAYKLATCLDDSCSSPAVVSGATLSKGTVADAVRNANDVKAYPFAEAIIANMIFTDISDIQATKGFVLVRASGTVLRDSSANDPTNSGGTTIATDGILGLVSEGAIALREDTDPIVSVSRHQDATPNPRNNRRYTFKFRVTSSKTIRDISEEGSYRLLRSVVGGDPVATGFTINSTSIDSKSTRTDITYDVAITYDVTIADIAITRQTAGFILARSADTGNNQKFLDAFSNPPSGIGPGEAFAGAKNLARRDTVRPKITLRARQIQQAVLGEEVIEDQHNVVFRVTSKDSDVLSALRNSASYQLLLINKEDVSMVVGQSTDTMPHIVSINIVDLADGAEVTYRVMISDSELNQIEGFTLVSTSTLLDSSGNLPDMVNVGERIADIVATPATYIRARVFLEGSIRRNSQ